MIWRIDPEHIRITWAIGKQGFAKASSSENFSELRLIIGKVSLEELLKHLQPASLRSLGPNLVMVATKNSYFQVITI